MYMYMYTYICICIYTFYLPTRWATRISSPHQSAWYVTRFAIHKALKSIAWCKLIFDERVVVHRLDRVLD